MKINQLIKIFSAAAMSLLLTISFVFEISAQKKVPRRKTSTDSKTSQNRDLSPVSETSVKPSETKTEPKIKSEDIDRTPHKKIVVVLDFEDDNSGNAQLKFGKQIALLLSNEFSKSGTYTIVERPGLERIIKEQGLSAEELFDPKTAARVGKLLSASAVVLGTITEYTTEKNKIGIKRFARLTFKAKLGLAIRLVDVNTLKVLNSVTVEETAKEDAYSVVGIGSTETEITPDLKISLFTKAAKKAVADAISKLTPIIEKTSAQNNPTESVPIKETSGDDKSPKPNPEKSNQSNSTFPQVAKVSGNKVYVVDAGDNVKVGDVFSVMRGEPVKHPVSGKIMGIDGKEIARLKVIEINEGLVTAQVISGTGIREKDFVKPVK